MLFWIIALGAAALVGLALARPLLTRGADAAPRAAHDAQVFRDQLKELENDVSRGVVAEEDAAATKLEISRRLLAADEEVRQAGGAGPAPRGLSRAMAAILVIAAPLGAGALYWEVGAPGAEDQPLASRSAPGRPGQEEAEKMMAGRQPPPPAGPEAAEFRTLVGQLEDRLAQQPDDAQGRFLYARSLMNLARFGEAWRQFQRVVDLRGGDAEVYAGLAEGMILAAGGYISPEAEENLLNVLKWDPSNPSARYYLGHLHKQSDRPGVAADIWERLLAESPSDAPWVAPIQAELADLGPASRTVLRGPTPEEMQAAGNLPPEDRQAMVRQMVEGLAARLEEQGGSVEEWQRLIRSYSVLGQPGRARDAMAAARAALAGDPVALSRLESGSAPLPGPNQEQMAAAAEQPMGERKAMIEGMVQRLADRLAAEGGAPEEWLRLISSYNVLGKRDEARAAYLSAREAFAGDASALAMLESAVEGAPRAASPGPTREDIAAAQEMTPEDRQEMIRGMVARLHDRLREEGRAGDANEWGKLMRSYSVLGDTGAVMAAYEEATEIYDDDAISLAYLKEAALLAGAEFE